jgi:hypothetical protein
MKRGEPRHEDLIDSILSDQNLLKFFEIQNLTCIRRMRNHVTKILLLVYQRILW